MTTTDRRPAFGGIHHVAVTASDVETSVAWYQRVFGMDRLPPRFPHHGPDAKGYAIVLVEPETGMCLAVEHHPDNDGAGADERRCGVDHISFAMISREHLDTWASWLDFLGIAHSGPVDAGDPMPYAALVFRDPDNVQLELFSMDQG